MVKLFKYITKKDWALMFLVVVLIVVQVWFDLKIPDYTVKLTTIVQTKNASMNEVWINGGTMLLLAFGSLASAIVCAILISRIASSFSMTLREEMFSSIAGFSNNEMNQFSTPSLITRTTNDVNQMQNFVAMGVQMIFKAPILAIWAILKISSTNVPWTIATVICVAVIVVVVGVLIFLCLPRFKKIQKLTDRLNDVTRENVSGVRVVRAFNGENYQEQKFEDVNEEITQNNLFTTKAMGVLMPIMTICMNGLSIAIYWIAAILINDITLGSFNGDMSAFVMERVVLVGNMTAFTQYAMQIVMAFMMLIMIFIILPRTIVSGKRIYEVLSTKPSIVSGSGNVDGNVKGELEFKNVSFQYTSEAGYAIRNISFKLNRGETLAIIGATGSGKTTIANLIPRFYDVTKGEILFNGVNIKEYQEEDLRKRVSIASQKAALFKCSIKDNITYGSSDIDDEKVQDAIQISQSDFVYTLEGGIESPVAQGGTNLSGGQKQRISIARAIYKDSELIIFDDTFSALDYKTDMLVRKGIKENLKDTTIIIVAQRIGTIKNADKIIVLDQGKIVGAGKHQELLKNCEIYKEIALSQLSAEEL